MTWVPGPLAALTIGIVAGRLSGMRLGVGARFSSSYLLRAGIVLLGLRLSVEQLRDLGADALLVIASCVIFGGGTAYAAAAMMGLSRNLRILLAAGTAICGNSAIVALAPSIGAEDEELALAVTTVTIYGTIALFAFPLIAHAMRMDELFFAVWTGTAINDTSQVVAASFTMSDEAGTLAAIVKLSRNLFIVPTVLAASLFSLRAGGRSSSTVSRTLISGIPWFIVLFVLAAISASVFDLPEGLVNSASDVSKIFIIAALMGIGVGAARFQMDRRLLYPLLAGVAAGILLALFSLIVVHLVG